MPIFHPPKGKWIKLCEVCGKPFMKTAKVQKRCENCKKPTGGIRHLKSFKK